MSNRYSRITPSQFSPLTTEEIMAVPLAKRQQHNQAVQSLDELGLFDINRLEQDEEAASGFINEYTKGVHSKADEIMQKGINQSTIRDVIKLKNERDNFLKGDGKKIGDAYVAFQKNKAVADQMLQSGKIDGQRHSEIMRIAEEGYKGFKEGPYQDYYGAASTDVGAYMQDALKNLDPSVISADYGLTSIGNGMYRYASETAKGRNRLTMNADGSISQDDLVRQYALERANGNPEIAADMQHRIKNDPNFDPNQFIGDMATTIYKGNSNIQRELRSGYGNYPQDGSGRSKSSSSKEEELGKSNVYAIDSTSRLVFPGAKNANEVKAQYTNLLNSDDPKKVNEGRRMEAHYERAMEQFRNNSLNKNINEQYNKAIKNSGLEKLAEKLNTTVNHLVSSANGAGFNRAMNQFKKNEDGSYSLLERKYSNGKERYQRKGDRITKSEYETIKREGVKYKDISDKYNNALNDHLENYADNTREYMIMDLKESRVKEINRGLNSFVMNAPQGNLSQSVYKLTDNEGNEIDKEDIDEKIGKIQAGKYNSSFISYSGENENGLPVLKLKYENPADDGDSGILEIEISKLYADKGSVKNAEAYILDIFENEGGLEGKAIASRSRDRIKHKDFVPDSHTTFKENNELKPLIHNNISNKISSIKGLENFKVDISRIYSPEGRKQYSLMVGDENGNSRGLQWGDLFKSPDDFLQLGNSRIAQFIGDEIVRENGYRSMDEISEDDFKNKINELINNKSDITMDSHYDLLNLLGNK